MPMEFTWGDDFGIFLAFYLIVMGIGLVFYIIQSAALYTLAKRRNLPGPGLAWVPLGNVWVIGSLSDQYQSYTANRITNRRKILLWLSVGAFVLTVFLFGMLLALAGKESSMAGATFVLGVLIFYLGFFGIAIASVVFQYIALYDIFSSCDPNNATAFLIVSILFAVALPFLLFSCRKKDLGMISWQQKQWQMQQAWQQSQWYAQQPQQWHGSQNP